MTNDTNEKPRRARAKGDVLTMTSAQVRQWVETMTSTQFRQWVADVGYRPVAPPAERKGKRAERPTQRKIPYDVKQIAQDLGLSTQQVYNFWWGQNSSGKPVVMSEPVALLCLERLKSRRLEQRLGVVEAELSRFKAAAKLLMARDD